jgi:HlyD family secretion protein
MDTRMKWGLGAAAVLVVLAAVALGTTRGVPVRTVAVTRGAIAKSVVATGRVEARARIDLGSEVTATVREVRVREGDRVREVARSDAQRPMDVPQGMISR